VARRRRSFPVGVVLGLIIMIAAAWVLARHWQAMPWQPLSLSEPVGPFTRYKIARLRDDLPACRALLADAGAAFTRSPVVRAGPNCGYADGVRSSDRRLPRYQPATPHSCVTALGLVLWEQQTVQPEARLLLGSRIVSIETLGTYNCRRIGSGATGQFSEHARANAIDITAFRLADGRRISVLDDWQGNGPEATFLRRARNGACGSFATVLSPDYNAAHRDHFHFDQAKRGGWGLCR
jgi:hypothetical protein